VALIVLDASVVIAHLDASDALHAQATAALDAHAADDLRLPATAYAEVLVRPVRDGRLAQARDDVSALGLVVVPVDEQLAERAARVRAAATNLRLPDAVVVACGEALNADVILTADRRWQGLARVRVIG
jgi:predicted nucleic acid-binding protein